MMRTAGRFQQRETAAAKKGVDVATLQFLVKESENASFSSLLQVRLRYRQTKNLLADVLDAIEQYIVGTVQFSRSRVQMLERVQVSFRVFYSL
jgi:hypothetical protein